MDWQIIISLITLALVIFGIIWGNGLWARREKIKINIHGPSYTATDFDRRLKVFWTCELQRLGGERVRYTARILLKPDKQTYKKLQKYISLPPDGIIPITNRLELTREEIVSWGHWNGDVAVYPEYEASKKTIGTEQWKTIYQLTSELEQKVFQVSLVWEDGGKTKWKTIKQGVSGWVTL